MNSALVLLLGVAAVAAVPDEFRGQRIVGGSQTTINTYPFGVALLSSLTGTNHRQSCGGSIINQRSILTAAHCFMIFPLASQWRSRVGSTFANSGGHVFNTQQLIRHNHFNTGNLDNDFAIVRVQGQIGYSNTVQPARIAGPNYHLADNQAVWAFGWGHIRYGGPSSEHLLHVQVWTINQNLCAQQYSRRNMAITANMLCSGWWNVGGRDQCQGDSGGPLLHNGVVVGVCSFGRQCALPTYPGVNARVSRASQWISNNA